MENCILAFDIGTSAVKASLVSENLKILSEASQSYGTRHPAPQQAEQSAKDWWDSAVLAARRLFEMNADAAQKVCAIGVS